MVNKYWYAICTMHVAIYSCDLHNCMLHLVLTKRENVMRKHNFDFKQGSFKIMLGESQIIE